MLFSLYNIQVHHGVQCGEDEQTVHSHFVVHCKSTETSEMQPNDKCEKRLELRLPGTVREDFDPPRKASTPFVTETVSAARSSVVANTLGGPSPVLAAGPFELWNACTAMQDKKNDACPSVQITCPSPTLPEPPLNICEIFPTPPSDDDSDHKPRLRHKSFINSENEPVERFVVLDEEIKTNVCCDVPSTPTAHLNKCPSVIEIDCPLLEKDKEISTPENPVSLEVDSVVIIQETVAKDVKHANPEPQDQEHPGPMGIPVVPSEQHLASSNACAAYLAPPHCEQQPVGNSLPTFAGMPPPSLSIAQQMHQQHMHATTMPTAFYNYGGCYPQQTGGFCQQAPVHPIMVNMQHAPIAAYPPLAFGQNQMFATAQNNAQMFSQVPYFDEDNVEYRCCYNACHVQFSSGFISALGIISAVLHLIMATILLSGRVESFAGNLMNWFCEKQPVVLPHPEKLVLEPVILFDHRFSMVRNFGDTITFNRTAFFLSHDGINSSLSYGTNVSSSEINQFFSSPKPDMRNDFLSISTSFLASANFTATLSTNSNEVDLNRTTEEPKSDRGPALKTTPKQQHTLIAEPKASPVLGLPSISDKIRYYCESYDRVHTLLYHRLRPFALTYNVAWIIVCCLVVFGVTTSSCWFLVPYLIIRALSMASWLAFGLLLAVILVQYQSYLTKAMCCVGLMVITGVVVMEAWFFTAVLRCFKYLCALADHSTRRRTSKRRAANLCQPYIHYNQQQQALINLAVTPRPINAIVI